METLKFQSTINAPREKVWATLWNDDTYRKWTAAFCEGSYAESDWNEGSKILFLSPGGEGMFSIIDKKVPNEQMTFRHLGEVRNGIEEPKDWANALESYHLKEQDGTTELFVSVDINDEFAEQFKNIFPRALDAVKELAEKN